MTPVSSTLPQTPALISGTDSKSLLFTSHTIQAGENLSTVAQKYGVRVLDLLLFNLEYNFDSMEQADPELLHRALLIQHDDAQLAKLNVMLKPGQKILIPMNHTRCAFNAASIDEQSTWFAQCGSRQMPLFAVATGVKQQHSALYGSNAALKDLLQGRADRAQAAAVVWSLTDPNGIPVTTARVVAINRFKLNQNTLLNQIQASNPNPQRLLTATAEAQRRLNSQVACAAAEIDEQKAYGMVTEGQLTEIVDHCAKAE